MSRHFTHINEALEDSINLLKRYGVEVDTGHWQGVTTEGKPDLVTKELLNLTFSARMPKTEERAGIEISPNLPWAEDHFQERVSRVPSNPGEEYKNWPWWRGQDDQALTEGRGPTDPKFTHTYQERFWPKQAWVKDHPDHVAVVHGVENEVSMKGIRYAYGDLDDVVNLLYEHPHTRQATFPIFFPEDTGAVHGGRIPCSLHYHFLLRNGKLNLWYPIRSCDAVRHFRDDVYLATRLCQWVIEQLVEKELQTGNIYGPLWTDVDPGLLYFTAYSFHVHKGDIHLL